MVDLKTALGYLATIISFGSYIPYFRSIFAGKTKPHAFSWFVWGLLTAIAFAAQVSEKAGAGSWVTASTAVACFAVFFVALWKGYRDFVKLDWFALFSALVAIILWALTKNPLLSIILVTVADALGFLPTFRKGYYHPHEETMTLYSFSTLKYAIGIFALESLIFTTWLFPASLVLTNGLFVLMILHRRSKISLK
ncbi:MAG: hypothetical protein Q8R08_02470 [bacterium]|nr:hypothetical protein [bacterium]